MPCRYIETPQEIKQRVKEAQERNVKPHVVKAEKYKKELDKVTRLLCVMCNFATTELAAKNSIGKFLKDNYNDHWGIDKELLDWWVEHQEKDESRKQEEKRAGEVAALKAQAKKLGFSVSRKKSS